MARWEIEKVAAAHLLEALRVAMDHLRDFTMAGESADMGASRNASATYAQVRRLRTYAQRCVSAYTEIVELDLNEEDQNLMAACAIFEVANLDKKLNGPVRPKGDEVGWLEERRRALTHWSVSFATRRVDHIPVADESVFLTPSVQNLLREVQRRVVAQGQRSGVHRVTREMAGVPTIPTAAPPPPPPAHPAYPPEAYAPRAPSPQHPAQHPGHQPHAHPVAPPPAYVDPAWAAQQHAVPHAPAPPGYEGYYSGYPPPQDPRVAAAPPPPPPPPPHYYHPPVEDPRRAPGASRQFGIPQPPAGMPGAPAPARPAPPPGYSPPGYPPPGYPPPQQAYGQPAEPPAAPWPVATPVATEDPAAEQPPGSGLDLDPRKLHDPRVRAILMLELRAYERALRANDHRLCVVHLGSVLEASCIDYALTHRRDLALNGAPETWNLEIVVRRVLGEDISSMDRALLFHLNAARNLLRPAIQLSNPMVVTVATQSELTQFVRRVLTAMGYSSSGEPPPPLVPQAAAAGMAGGHPHAMPAAPPPRPGNPGLPGWLRGT